MDDTPIIRKYTDVDEMKADEYRYWQSRPAHERLDAVEEMIETAYALRAEIIPKHAPSLATSGARARLLHTALVYRCSRARIYRMAPLFSCTVSMTKSRVG
jgi:hypothetical protein